MSEKEIPKVLLIEDDKFIRKALSIGLSNNNFNVLTASNGQEGFEMIKQEKPDLVLLDLIMPVKTGFEVLEDIKIAGGELAKIPIIVLSNLGQAEDISRCKDLGAIDYFIKSNLSMKEVVKKTKFYLAKFVGN